MIALILSRFSGRLSFHTASTNQRGLFPHSGPNSPSMMHSEPCVPFLSDAAFGFSPSFEQSTRTQPCSVGSENSNQVNWNPSCCWMNYGHWVFFYLLPFSFGWNLFIRISPSALHQYWLCWPQKSCLYGQRNKSGRPSFLPFYIHLSCLSSISPPTQSYFWFSFSFHIYVQKFAKLLRLSSYLLMLRLEDWSLHRGGLLSHNPLSVTGLLPGTTGEPMSKVFILFPARTCALIHLFIHARS